MYKEGQNPQLSQNCINVLPVRLIITQSVKNNSQWYCIIIVAITITGEYSHDFLGAANIVWSVYNIWGNCRCEAKINSYKWNFYAKQEASFILHIRGSIYTGRHISGLITAGLFLCIRVHVYNVVLFLGGAKRPFPDFCSPLRMPPKSASDNNDSNNVTIINILIY